MNSGIKSYPVTFYNRIMSYSYTLLWYRIKSFRFYLIRFVTLLFIISITSTRNASAIDRLVTIPQNNKAHDLPISSSSSSSSGIAADLSWDFEDGLGRWGSGSATLHVGDELWMDIIGNEHGHGYGQKKDGKDVNAHIDSPLMDYGVYFVDEHLSKKFSIVFRYRYVHEGRCMRVGTHNTGSSRSCRGKLRLRSRMTKEELRETMTLTNADHGFVDWGGDDIYNTQPGKEGSEGSKGSEGFLDVPFTILGDGQWHIAYVDVDWEDEDVNQSMNGGISQMRLWPSFVDTDEVMGESKSSSNNSSTTLLASSMSSSSSSSFQMDWIRILRGGPVIRRITGCRGEKYSNSVSFQDIIYDITTHLDLEHVNPLLGHTRTTWNKREMNLKSFHHHGGYNGTHGGNDDDDDDTGSHLYEYASTYNCLRGGGEVITIEGYNFGAGGVNGSGAPAHVYVDERPCTHVTHDIIHPQRRLTCITPPSMEIVDDDGDNSRTSTSWVYSHGASVVEVRNGKLPGLKGTSTWLAYATPPPRPVHVSLSHFASRSIDVSWRPGGHVGQQMTYTGYKIYWKKKKKEFKSESESWSNVETFGNITTTTIGNLEPDTTYIFGVAGLNENQSDGHWWNDLDVYGRRRSSEKSDNEVHLGDVSSLSPSSPLMGPIVEIEGHTLAHDIHFHRFDANSTLNHGPEVHDDVNDHSNDGDDITSSSSLGPTGVDGGEGHYGLYLIGSATIQNCNTSSFCCDVFDEETGDCIDESSLTCLATFEMEMGEFHNNIQAETTFLHDQNDDEDQDTMQLPGGGKAISSLSTYHDNDRYLFNAPCGPALHLTHSSPRLKGAAWYHRQMEVGEGFDTQFSFEISNPSFRCNNMDKVYTNCRSRGGDGFAFIIHATDSSNLGPGTIGNPGLGLGYDGIPNSLAVEFDTYHNYEVLDPYENHVSVHTRGSQHPISVNHTYSLGHTNAVPDLTDGRIRIRIKYEPFVFDQSFFSKPSFVASPYLLHFFEDNDFHNGNGIPSWGAKGLGMLHVYCNDMNVPVLTVPLHLSATLDLNMGRAWVGFTASTGDETWQSHDIFDWQFSSLRQMH